jgi:hypothetical protein
MEHQPKTNFVGAAAIGASGTLLYVWTARRVPSSE